MKHAVICPDGVQPSAQRGNFNRYALADAAGVQPRGTAYAVFGLPVHGNLRYMCDGVSCV